MKRAVCVYYFLFFLLLFGRLWAFMKLKKNPKPAQHNDQNKNIFYSYKVVSGIKYIFLANINFKPSY